MDLSLSNILLFVGIVQCLMIFVVIICSRSKRILSKRYFTGFIAILSLATLGMFLDSSIDIVLISLEWQLLLGYFPFYPVMLLGPFTWMYIQSLFEKDFQHNKMLNRHFFLVFLDLIPFIASFFMWVFLLFGFISYKGVLSLMNHLDQYNTYVDIPRYFSVGTYLIMSWSYLRKVKYIADVRTYNWGKELLMGLTIIIVVWTPLLFLYVSPWQKLLLNSIYYFPIYYLIVGLIYYLSIKLMMGNLSFRPNLFNAKDIDQKKKILDGVIAKDRLYAHHNFQLKNLSEKSGIPEKTVSFILNHHLRKSFNDFLNEYRVQEAINKINKGEMKNKTLEGIALEVGFSSRSTFNRGFKKYTGEHPSDYIKYL